LRVWSCEDPGSTSTKIAVYDGDKPVFEKTLRHDPVELEPYPTIIDQYEFRKKIVLEAMEENSVHPNTLDAVVGRGGLVKSVPGGTFRINEAMLRDLRDPSLWGRTHASNLGAFIADSIAQELRIPGFIVDPVVVDEFDDLARISGIPEIERKSLLHALNIRYIARLMAGELGKELKDVNLVGVHMGGGISVAAIRAGRVVDVNNALLGMGPFSPQRAGAMPIGDLLELAYSGKFTHPELIKYLTKTAGLMAYLLVWLSTVWGLAVSSKVFDGAVHRTFTYDFHQFISLLSIAFVVVHLVVLLFDQYQPFTLAQILVPFTAPYRSVWVGLGTIGLYLTLIVTVTFYIRKWIGQKTFRLIHLASYLAFAGAAVHGLLSGTDSPLASVQAMYLVTAISVVFLTVYRILMSASNKRRRVAVQRA